MSRTADDDDDIDDALINQFKTATVTLAYLNTNGTSHASPLLAIAELTDNSKDAKAKTLRIDFVERDGLETIEVLDDGSGMSPQEAANIIAFGHSNKRSDNTEMIGRYGNGLKSGGLRLGSELLLLTKKENTYTAMLISNKFHEKRRFKQQVFVPCPSFDENFRPITKNRKLHEAEVKVINTYGPLGRWSLEDLFMKITSPSGTLIIIDKLRRDNHCRLEMNFSNKEDFQLDQDNCQKWQTSLRAYLEILYQNSHMKIYLRGVEVKEKFLYASWMFKKRVAKANLQFKEMHARIVAEAENKCQEIAMRISDIKSQINEDNNRVQPFHLGAKRNTRQNHSLLEIESEAFKKAEKEKKELMKKNGKPSSSVFFSIGVNVEDRSADGIYFYLNGRLIKVVYRELKFYSDEENLGISGQVNFTYETFLPTQSKADFANQKDFQSYLNLCKSWLKIYMHELKTEMIPNFLQQMIPGKRELKMENIMSTFWKAVGYPSEHRSCIRGSVPEATNDIIELNAGYYRRCKLCGKWNGVSEDPGSDNLECRRLNKRCGDSAGADTIFSKLNMDLGPAPKKKMAPIRSQARNHSKAIEARSSRSEKEPLMPAAERLADEPRPRRSGTKRDYRDDSPKALSDDRRPHRDERHLYCADDDTDDVEDIFTSEVPSKKSKTSRHNTIKSRSDSLSGPSTSGPVASTSSSSKGLISLAASKLSNVVKPPTRRVSSPHREGSGSSSSSFNSSPRTSPQASRCPPLPLEKPFVSEITGYHLQKTHYDEYRSIRRNMEIVMEYWAANSPGGITVDNATLPAHQLAIVANKIQAMNEERNNQVMGTSQTPAPKQEPETPTKSEPKSPPNLRKRK